MVIKKTSAAGTNCKQQISNKPPSMPNLHCKSSQVIKRAEKAIQHDSPPSRQPSKYKQLATSKTKCPTYTRSNEYCTFSTGRLRSFPAEEMKRCKPVQKPVNPPVLHESQSECQITIPEVIIPASNLRPEAPPHRPFVPAPRGGTKDPQITTSLIINPTANGFKAEDQASENLDTNIKEILAEVENEKQPIGGRCALLHRLKCLEQKKQQNSSQNSQDHSGQAYYDFYDKSVEPARPDQGLNQNYKYGNNNNSNIQKNSNRVRNHTVANRQELQCVQYDGYPPRKSKFSKQKSQEADVPFTPAMLQDQKLLLRTLKLHGVPKDVMKRQYSALVKEHRRYLMYSQQFEEPKEVTEEVSARKKTTSFQEDLKPDWMMHITPPCIPYATAEKMNNVQNSKNVRFNDEYNQIVPKNGLQHNANFHSVYQPPNQNMMINVPNDGHCKCHHCVINNQNYLVQQQAMPNNGYYVQYPAQQQNFAMPSHYFMNSGLNHANDLNYANNYPQNNEGFVQENMNNQIIQYNKQHNGLQGEEMIKADMEELKNHQNQSGYEYLAGTNGRNRRLILNGTQDPEDDMMQSRPFQRPYVEEIRRGEPRANGLANNRNPNNPPPPPNGNKVFCETVINEYPRQKDGVEWQLPEENQQFLPVLKNNTNCTRNPYMARVYQGQGQAVGPPCNNGYQLIRSNTMPCDTYSRRQIHSNAFEMQNQRPSNNLNNFQYNTENVAFPSSYNNGHQNSLNPGCELSSQVNPNNFRNFQSPYQVIQPRIIGGMQYFATKNNSPNRSNFSNSPNE